MAQINQPLDRFGQVNQVANQALGKAGQFNQVLDRIGKLSPIAPLILRVTLGVLLVLNGIDKFAGGITNVQAFFAESGVPLATVTAPLAAFLEIVIGTALIAGLLTRVSAIVMTGFFAVAIATVKASGGILGSADIDLLYTAGLVSLLLLGPGALAVDNLIAKRAAKADVTERDLQPKAPKISPPAPSLT